MKKLINSFYLGICSCIAVTCTTQPVIGQEIPQRNYLANALRGQPAVYYFQDLGKWRSQKKQEVIAAFQSLSNSEKQQIISAADKLMEYNWPSLKAIQFLEYKTIGNRSNYEASLSERRNKLSTLIAAELVEGKGKYLPQITNGLWLLLEESTWVLPAHMSLQKAGVGLADPQEPIVDLTAGETSALVSWVHLLLQPQLNQISPELCKRIRFELDRRIVQPYLQHNDFWWMGFGKRMVNNWNIWINRNLLLTTLLMVDDSSDRSKMLEKLLLSADKFINGYPNDGGCDEGPTYWGHAGGKLIEFITLLSDASYGKINFSDKSLIHNIGSYIYKMHIDSNRMVNFADAKAYNIPHPDNVYAYGKLFNDSTLMQFGAWLYRLQNADGERHTHEFFSEFVNELEYRQELLSTTPKAPFPQESWLPNLQVLALRSKKGASKGLFFAAQGGHNNESHNHNDVGNFVLYVDGKPAIVDAGVGTYTAKTFSDERYTLWNMQSQWHNCPTINGVMQKEGKMFKATEVHFQSTSFQKTLSMDIASAYPSDAEVNKYQRSFIFEPSKHKLELKEVYSMKTVKAPLQLHFMTCLATSSSKNGELILVDSNGKAKLKLKYNPGVFNLKEDSKELDDPRLSKVWGSQLKRITLEVKHQNRSGNHSIIFTQL
ncbi:heparinase II/III domain-containing protein [Solitalea lacus]|uniref:heparinase II/III domain-containing protein n=1 Tax=Solitalea lacus TaxID=2911172 RepID=UPI001EDBC8F5|nr:heparinase II/III family protein [Solitalea lacus]UKJ07445.1 heparinase II/III-family protein [Solitalea lacus]